AALAPAASAAVAVDRPNESQVLVAADGAAPRIVARDGAAPSLSADGRVLAYVRSEEGTIRLVSGRRGRTLTQREKGRRSTPHHIETVELSANARTILARDRYRWRVIDVASRAAHTVTQDESVRPRFSADGAWIAWAGQSGGAYVRRTDGKGGTVRIGPADAHGVAWLGNELAVLHGAAGARTVTAFTPGTPAQRPLPVAVGGATGLGPAFGTTRLTLLHSAEEERDLSRMDVVEVASGAVVRSIVPTGGLILGDSAGFSDDGGTLYVLRGATLTAVDLASGAERRLATRVGLELSATRR
ncbi:MAG TPA: hypothetical protein VN238_03520, partial [Solirubrobacteraceae bacterium]|nr:hypothetical protein [Solirubrobacteraceae bacterium]